MQYPVIKLAVQAFSVNQHATSGQYCFSLSSLSFLTGRYELNKLTSLPMCGFIAQLVEHCTGIAEGKGSNPVEALIFFRLLLFSCLNWKIYCDDHSSLSKFLPFAKCCLINSNFGGTSCIPSAL